MLVESVSDKYTFFMSLCFYSDKETLNLNKNVLDTTCRSQSLHEIGRVG